MSKTRNVFIKKVVHKAQPFAFGLYNNKDVYISPQVYQDHNAVAMEHFRASKSPTAMENPMNAK